MNEAPVAEWYLITAIISLLCLVCFFVFFFLIQFNAPFKIISAHMRRANQ